MKALVRTKFDTLDIVDIPIPEVKEKDDVKIRLVYSSFCRDDMRLDDKSDVFAHTGIMGHEAVGIIEELGQYASFSGLAVGDLVMALPWSFCGRCHYCLAQKPQYCNQSHIHQGTMCQYIVRSCRQVIKVPNKLSYKHAVMMEPIGAIVEALNTLNISYNTRVAIIGGGFIGLSFLKFIQLRGAREVTVIEPIQERREQALKYGADFVIDPMSGDFHFDLSDCCDHEGFNVIIETSSDINMIEITLPYLSKGGEMKIFTYYGSKEKVSLPLLNLYASNITISWTSFCGIESVLTAAHMINKLSLDELITAEFDFDDSISAFETYKKLDHFKIGIKNF
jgi:threonine dehydrogenase-like Zn-dependent dehydrogenase